MEDNKIYEVFVKWYSLPREKRKPPTMEEFSRTYKISLKDMMSFMDKDVFYEDLAKQTQNWAKSKTPELMHILYEQYKNKKNPADLRLWKEFAFPEEKKVDPIQPLYQLNVFNPTDEQRQQIIERLARRDSLPGADGQN